MPQPFPELQWEMVSLYHQERYEDALELVRSGLDDHPAEHPRMTFWLACLECRLGRTGQALETLATYITGGGWMSPHHLKYDDDLSPLRGNPEFERIIEVCEARRAQEQTRVEPKLLIESPAHGSAEPPPLLIALHMMGGAADESLHHWRPATNLGMLLAAPQGSELLGPGSFAWSDSTAGELQRHLATLSSDAPFDPKRVILGGASQGGRFAARLTMEGSVSARGFIALVGAPPPETVVAQVGKSREAGVRGVFITGEHDRAREGIEATHRLLEEAGLGVRLIVVPGLGHDYPSNFSDLIHEALEFVLAD